MFLNLLFLLIIFIISLVLNTFSEFSLKSVLFVSVLVIVLSVLLVFFLFKSSFISSDQLIVFLLGIVSYEVFIDILIWGLFYLNLINLSSFIFIFKFSLYPFSYYFLLFKNLSFNFLFIKSILFYYLFISKLISSLLFGVFVSNDLFFLTCLFTSSIILIKYSVQLNLNSFILNSFILSNTYSLLLISCNNFLLGCLYFLVSTFFQFYILSIFYSSNYYRFNYNSYFFLLVFNGLPVFIISWLKFSMFNYVIDSSVIINFLFLFLSCIYGFYSFYLFIVLNFRLYNSSFIFNILTILLCLLSCLVVFFFIVDLSFFMELCYYLSLDSNVLDIHKDLNFSNEYFRFYNNYENVNISRLQVVHNVNFNLDNLDEVVIMMDTDSEKNVTKNIINYQNLSLDFNKIPLKGLSIFISLGLLGISLFVVLFDMK